jgi:hypothetical protein
MCAVSIAERLQAGHAAVAGVAEKLQRTAKIKRSRIVPQMFLKLPRHFTVGSINVYASISYKYSSTRQPGLPLEKHLYLRRGSIEERRLAVITAFVLAKGHVPIMMERREVLLENQQC